jgi:hypothetical protein
MPRTYDNNPKIEIFSTRIYINKNTVSMLNCLLIFSYNDIFKFTAQAPFH